MQGIRRNGNSTPAAARDGEGGRREAAQGGQLGGRCGQHHRSVQLIAELFAAAAAAGAAWRERVNGQPAAGQGCSHNGAA